MKRLIVNLLASAAVILVGLLCLRLDSYLSLALPAVPELASWIFLLTGLGLIALAEAAFLTRGAPTGAPADPTRRLVLSGICRWGRNPISLGVALVILGAALANRSPILLLAAVLFPIVMHSTVVRAEENRLNANSAGNIRNINDKCRPGHQEYQRNG
jgi:protein-S-isoprenylcysteine O-methyltransferase Ste14